MYKEAGCCFGVSDRSICRWIRLRKEPECLHPRFVSGSSHKRKEEECWSLFREIAAKRQYMMPLGVLALHIKNKKYIDQEMKGSGKDLLNL